MPHQRGLGRRERETNPPPPSVSEPNRPGPMSQTMDSAVSTADLPESESTSLSLFSATEPPVKSTKGRGFYRCQASPQCAAAPAGIGEAEQCRAHSVKTPADTALWV